MTDEPSDEDWSPPLVMLAVDLVILTVRERTLRILLVERGVPPFAGMLALPGGFLGDEAEDVRLAATRELAEEAGLDATTLHLEQIGAYGAPARDPRGRVISVAYLAIAPRLPDPVPGSDAADARWEPATAVLSGQLPVAFDHREIIADGIEQARAKLEHTTLATAFCHENFTITELQHVYEAVWDLRLDPRNFARKVRRTEGFVAPAGTPRRTGSGRPAQLFQRGEGRVLYPPMTRATTATVTGTPGEETAG
ncbi:NUDIX hydrolase [Longispora albida]|uniref:NUDIX hydrolase n=1 Tax=Longispora albida TaxID=203523 RepID=UPI00037CB468|nr:NUDIX domain-containing protein [Longispora albida]